MKNIKVVLIALLGFISRSGSAQTFNAKTSTAPQTNAAFGSYGHTPWATQQGIICAVISNTVTPISKPLDTLWSSLAVDTGYVQFTNPNSFNRLFDFSVTKISGTCGGTILLQGSIDNATWHTLTGNTTYCTGCGGASITATNMAGTVHYQFFIPKDAENYPYMQCRYITTDTSGHQTYNGVMGYQN